MSLDSRLQELNGQHHTFEGKAGIYWKVLCQEEYMDNKQICQWMKNEEDVKWSGLKRGMRA